MFAIILANMTKDNTVSRLLQEIRVKLNFTQEQLAERLGVSFATVNRWENGLNAPQKSARTIIEALAVEAGVSLEGEDAPANVAPSITRRRRVAAVPTTKPMEQMLWDAACSIRGEKDAAKFKDYLLPLLFLKRLSDVFDDEIDRLAEDYGDRATALEIVEGDHSLLRFYVPHESRWAVLSGRETYAWPDEAAKPKDIGEHLTKAVRAVVKQNPGLAGVIDVVDFAAERNGERDINPAKLRSVVETFSDPRYRLGLADVEPDFLGRAYEYLLRKFAEGSGQSAGEFFTPTEVGFLMANILRPKPGEVCHDYACGSAGLLVKLQLVCKELNPLSKVPVQLTGQELQAESYAVAKMNGIIHDMEIEITRGDTMINPKFRTPDGKVRTFDIVVANPMWNQPFAQDIFANDPFDRFRTSGGITTGKGDWAWLQHTVACMGDHGRAAVVLDTGAMTRGSGSKNEDKERNIRKWFVEQDLIDGVILLPENLFYNTNAAGVIVVLNKRKPAARKGRIVLLNASRHVKKGKPKNYIPEDNIRPLAAMYLKGEVVENTLALVTREQIEASDYALSPSRWVGQASDAEGRSLAELLKQVDQILIEDLDLTRKLMSSLAPLRAVQEQA
jgi:type I restriction enzyme M protein